MLTNLISSIMHNNENEQKLPDKKCHSRITNNWNNSHTDNDSTTHAKKFLLDILSQIVKLVTNKEYEQCFQLRMQRNFFNYRHNKKIMNIGKLTNRSILQRYLTWSLLYCMLLKNIPDNTFFQSTLQGWRGLDSGRIRG